MVTDEDRDYMYREYATDPRMRINLGIRRRLAPLMDNGRRRIELMHSLLFTLPGTPVMYYGDEIGMGDNIYLGDRNGVRTPMQWTSDRNAGFSRADYARLYAPVIADPVYGYQAINVEAQERTRSSLLNWIKRLHRACASATPPSPWASCAGSTTTTARCSPSPASTRARRSSSSATSRASPSPPCSTCASGRARCPWSSSARRPSRASPAVPYQLTLGPYMFLWFRLEKLAPGRGMP